MLRLDRSVSLVLTLCATAFVSSDAAAYASEPSCRIEGFKRHAAKSGEPFTTQQDIPAANDPIANGETFELVKVGPPGYTTASIFVWFHNRSSTSVSYRRNITVTVNGKTLPATFDGNNPRLIRTLAAGDSIRATHTSSEIYQEAGGFSGPNKISFTVDVTPTATRTTPSRCTFGFTLVRV